MPTAARTVDPMIAELEQESAATRRMLERVPGDKLTWAPHPRSMTLGQLAYHVAGVCGDVSNFLETDEFDAQQARFMPDQPESHAQIMEKFAEAQTSARRRLEALSEERAGQPWRLTNRSREVFAIPKVALVRTLMFNHLYHHRGQLSVYLRLLDVPVPVTYGRTADENPFA
jgi:uncharacterized damage-inducible protein DinB